MDGSGIRTDTGNKYNDDDDDYMVVRVKNIIQTYGTLLISQVSVAHPPCELLNLTFSLVTTRVLMDFALIIHSSSKSDNDSSNVSLGNRTTPLHLVGVAAGVAHPRTAFSSS